MGENEGLVRRVSAGGIAASHPELKPLPIFVGPSVGEEFNVVRSHLGPSACFRREDNSFEFDSSFVVDFDAGPLKELLDLHPGSKLSIFGHTDPVGQDDFNKVLSGRRAQSIFGLLLRDISLWEDLYRHHDTQGKDKWGVKSVQIMLNKLKFLTGREDGVLDEPTKEQLKKFETARGLAQSGFDSKQEIAKPTFTQLATEYMDVICTDDDDKPFKLTREDFLARGKGKDGKGDIQGCGEFNPILLFSKADKARLDQKENQPDRDEKNRPNRRVMILLFHPESEVDPNKWPCPTVKEGVAGCKARFFSDGEKRRSNQEKERKFDETKDTFACRFYQRLLEASPCERVLRSFDIRLYSPIGRAIPLSPCEITIGKRKPFADKANARGIITLRDVEVPATCHIGWGFPPDEGQKPELIFSLDLFLKAGEPLESDRSGESRRKLNNLGYNRPDPAENVRSFQREYGHLTSPPLDITGNIDNPTLNLIREVYEQSADDLRNTPVRPVS